MSRSRKGALRPCGRADEGGGGGGHNRKSLRPQHHSEDMASGPTESPLQH